MRAEGFKRPVQPTSRQIVGEERKIHRMAGREPPLVKHVMDKMIKKGEDVMFVNEVETPSCQWKIFCVCDGHGGPGAAKYVEEQLVQRLRRLLPPGPQPAMDTETGKDWAHLVASAITATFVALDEGFAERKCSSGTTISLAVLCGWFLSVANVGDSEVYIDTGTCVCELTNCHKVDDNIAEQERLTNAGAYLDTLSNENLTGPPRPGEEGVGPLRVWPGGVAVSRSLGDFECGSYVLCVPHIRQIIIPPTGCRLFLASDGLWDYFSGMRACRVARSSTLSKVPRRIFQTLFFHTDGRLTDDTTLLLVDIIPQGSSDFKPLAKQVRKNAKKQLQSWKDLLSFITYPIQEPVQEKLSFYNDIDASIEYPGLISRGCAIYKANKESGSSKDEGTPLGPFSNTVRFESNAVQVLGDPTFYKETKKSTQHGKESRTAAVSEVEPEGRRVIPPLSKTKSKLLKEGSTQDPIRIDPVQKVDIRLLTM